MEQGDFLYFLVLVRCSAIWSISGACAFHAALPSEGSRRRFEPFWKALSAIFVELASCVTKVRYVTSVCTPYSVVYPYYCPMWAGPDQAQGPSAKGPSEFDPRHETRKDLRAQRGHLIVGVRVL